MTARRAQVTAPVPESWRHALERLAGRHGRTLAAELRAALEGHFASLGEPYATPELPQGQLALALARGEFSTRRQ